MAEVWFVYVLSCGDGTLYTGIAKDDPKRRLAEHRAGRGARYTRGRLPIELEAVKGPLSRSDALKLEAKVKRLRSARKLEALGALRPQDRASKTKVGAAKKTTKQVASRSRTRTP